jgi:hypothetical protein
MWRSRQKQLAGFVDIKTRLQLITKKKAHFIGAIHQAVKFEIDHGLDQAINSYWIIRVGREGVADGIGSFRYEIAAVYKIECSRCADIKVRHLGENIGLRPWPLKKRSGVDRACRTYDIDVHYDEPVLGQYLVHRLKMRMRKMR